MDDGWEKVRKEVTCSVCLKIFEEPKILPCLHTFCVKCLQTLWQQADAVGINRIIHCPQCREKVQLSSVQELRPSFSVSHLLEIVDMQDRLSRGAPPTCQSCSKNAPAVASGTPCGIFLCSLCLDVHKTLKVTSSHQVHSLDDIRSGKVTIASILDHKQEMCSIHPDKSLELYCTNEECYICLGCAVVQHRNHRYDFISQIDIEHKEKINLKLTQLREQIIKMVAQAAAEVKNIQGELQKRQDENTCYVDKIFQEITITLAERKQQILYEINETTADIMQSLNEQYEDLTELQLQMNAYLELVDVILKSERDKDIMTMKDQMVNRGDTLLQVARLAKTTPVETVPSKIEFLCLESIKGLVKVMGISFNIDTCSLQLDGMLYSWSKPL